MACTKAKLIATLGELLTPSHSDMGAWYFRTQGKILHSTAMLDTSMETSSQASTSTIGSCSGKANGAMIGLTAFITWREKSMMAALHHTTTPTVEVMLTDILAWKLIVKAIVLVSVLFLTPHLTPAHTEEPLVTHMANQTTTHTKCSGFSTLTRAKSYLVKTSTEDSEDLQAVRNESEHISNRDSPDGGWFRLIRAHLDILWIWLHI